MYFVIPLKALLKRLTILFVLFNYLNTSVFFPEIVLVSSAITQSEDEINSVFEFLTDKCMDTPDDTPEDEDDDIPDGGKFGEKANESELHNTMVCSLSIIYNQNIENIYSNFYHFFYPDTHLDHFSPPPRLA